MKNILAIIIFVILLGGVFIVVHKFRKAAPTDLSRVKFSTKLIDVGNKNINDSVIAKYVVYNVGTSDLFISNVEPDCHCTVSSYSQNPIKPNDSSYIFLKYDSSIPGIFQSTALVTTNTKTSPVLLVFRGEIIPKR